MTHEFERDPKCSILMWSDRSVHVRLVRRGAAVCMHFLFLSAFFWLNTMCFNIWWTFR